MQLARFTTAETFELRPKIVQCARQAASSWARPRSAQDGAFERAYRAVSPVKIKAKQRMLKQRLQAHRRRPVERDGGRKSGKNPGRRIGESIPPGILLPHVPTAERRGDAAGQS